eukprot:TRINITY_DN36927_c0_g1_i1.p1 TRINITY_DN36927_c0_g1~~TRINITY_DN36927_c0_g1_i1.p1  ORF type:complete len:365 (+),score=39.11 TRINITY_DN36927_c0_g1_i1:98-1192(+)
MKSKKLTAALLAITAVAAATTGTGCTRDEDCTGDAWKCGKGAKDETVKDCSLPSDEGTGLTSKCTCFQPACKPVEVSVNDTKSKILFIGDMKFALLSDTFGVRYRNTHSTYTASREVGMNARWARKCVSTWLTTPSPFSYIVIQLGRMDSSNATAVMSSPETFRDNLKGLINTVNERSPSAKVVILPVMPMFKEAKLNHWDYNRIMAFNNISESMNTLANICPILDSDHFGSPKLCGNVNWSDVCVVQETDQLYPQETALQHDEEGLAMDLAFGFSSKEGDMITLTFINKCLLYSQPLEVVAKGNVVVKPPDVPIHFSYRSNSNVIWIRKKVRVRVRIRVRRRIRIRVRRYVRVRRRVRVRYYW